MPDETTERMRDRIRDELADKAADREQVARAIAERDRRIRQRAKKAVDAWIKRVLADYHAVDFHGALAGAPEGILMGWVMELHTLMHRLEELREALVENEIEQNEAAKHARQAVVATLYNIRPDVHLLPWFDMNARPGALAELGQYAAATRRLAQELMDLFHDCQASGTDSQTRSLLLP